MGDRRRHNGIRPSPYPTRVFVTPDQYCRTKAAPAGSGLYYGTLFVPSDQRRAIIALHALWRELDGVIDECSDSGVAHMKFAWWRTEIANLFGGVPQHPVTKALTAAVTRFRITPPQLNTIIDGIESNLNRDRYPDFDTLARCCYHVAGTVHVLMSEIGGYRNDATPHAAPEFGIAFGLTAVIRNVGRDARRGRIHLPHDELARFGVSEDDILESHETEGFVQLMQFQISRAHERYRQAAAALPAIDRRSQRAILALAAIHRSLLDEIAADGCRVLTRHTALTPLRKLWIAWKTGIQS